MHFPLFGFEFHHKEPNPLSTCQGNAGRSVPCFRWCSVLLEQRLPSQVFKSASWQSLHRNWEELSDDRCEGPEPPRGSRPWGWLLVIKMLLTVKFFFLCINFHETPTCYQVFLKMNSDQKVHRKTIHIMARHESVQSPEGENRKRAMH